MRLIDADAVAEAIRDEIVEAHAIEAAPDFIAGLKLGLAYVNTAETIDTEPVVRCKDCKYRKVFEYHYKDIGYCVTDCTIGNEGVIGTCQDDGYCSLAERKEKPNETD